MNLVDSQNSETGRNPSIASPAAWSRPPTQQELEMISQHDPQGFWTRFELSGDHSTNTLSALSSIGDICEIRQDLRDA